MCIYPLVRNVYYAMATYLWPNGRIPTTLACELWYPLLGEHHGGIKSRDCRSSNSSRNIVLHGDTKLVVKIGQKKKHDTLAI